MRSTLAGYKRTYASCPQDKAPLIVLGIETTCDDTGVALVTSAGEVLGEHVASQWSVHEKWGGIVPNLAAESHRRNLKVAVEAAVAASNVTLGDVDAIAVSTGPGLTPCLRVGGDYAAGMALALGKPLYSVHHLEAHLLTVRLTDASPPEYPFLSVLVTGGHTQLLLCKGLGDHVLLGSTLDDAVGEAFDKVARGLGVRFSEGGGRTIEKLAADGRPNRQTFTVPMRNRPRDEMDFSFSGLKTQVSKRLESLRGNGKELTRQDLAGKYCSLCHTC